ncbi:F-box domain-containing protein [Pleurotus pulmonarius]
MDSSTNQLPPEILSLVFSELEGNKASLCSCSLTCKSWHALSLAHIYRNLIVSNDLMYLRFYRQLMIDAPHLCCHVRRIDISGFGAPGTLDSFSLEWCDDDHIQTFLQAFPRLNNLKCSSLLYNVIPHVLPHMPITALHIQSSLSYDVHWLFRILRAGGATIKTLKLEDIDFRVKLSRQATPSGGKILMSALQELSLIDCCNIPFRRSTVDMPNLKTFVCESYGYPDYHSILPTSLTTLVVEPPLEECDRTQTIVDNLCLSKKTLIGLKQR